MRKGARNHPLLEKNSMGTGEPGQPSWQQWEKIMKNEKNKFFLVGKRLQWIQNVVEYINQDQNLEKANKIEFRIKDTMQLVV